MKFAKDILVLDFETTHYHPNLAEPIQLAAVLLDKETLKEKDSFSSFIASDLKNADTESMEISGVTPEKFTGAPSPAEVAKMFAEKFGFNVFLASWVGNLDRIMLRKIMEAANIDITQYDHHYLDLWPLAYVHLIKQGYSGGIRSEEMFKAFGLPARETHEALDDCRKEAEVLRKVIF